jgi:hypothetical protein
MENNSESSLLPMRCFPRERKSELATVDAADAAASREKWVYSGGEMPIWKLPDLLLVRIHILITY